MSRRKPTKVQQWFSDPIKERMRWKHANDRYMDDMLRTRGHELLEAEQRYIDDVLGLVDKMGER